jgi:hypothetical protein
MKMVFKFRIYVAILMTALMFAACEKDDPIDNGVEQESEKEVPAPDLPEVEVVMQDVVLNGVVRDTGGQPVEGVSVSTGSLTATTDNTGYFSFAKAATVNSRAVVRFEKDGYFPVTRSGVKEDEMMIETVMQERGNTDVSLQTSFNASEPQTLSVGDMKVDVPASSVVRADGSAYSGNVNADMLYLDPNNGNFNELMPGGDLAAIRSDNSEAQLISYGMTEISLADESGNRLQLKDGAASQLTFPIPAGMESNPPATIPLWYFDEERGVWIEEGTAALQGNVYVGSVTHFSWHNLDYPEDRVEIRGRVTDCDGLPVPHTKVTVDQTSDFTDSKGEYSVYVPANTPVTVTVKSRDYQGYSPEVTYDMPGHPGGSVVTQNISLPCVPKLRGALVNSCGPFISAFVWLEYADNGQVKETTPVYVTSSGTFTIYLPSAVNGKAVLYAEAPGGVRVSRDVNLNGSDIEVTVELCMDIDGQENILTFTQQGKAPYVLPIDYGRVQVFASEGGLVMFDGVMFVLSIPEYSKAKSSYDNVSVVIAYQEIVFATEDAHVDILNHGEKSVRFTIGGMGECVTVTGITGNATLSGTINAPINEITVGEGNQITKWADVGLPAGFPELPLPIDLLVKGEIMGLTGVNLYYKDAGKADYDRVINILSAAFGNGFDATQGSDKTSWAFMAGDYIIAVEYSPNGADVYNGVPYNLLVGIVY